MTKRRRIPVSSRQSHWHWHCTRGHARCQPRHPYTRHSATTTWIIERSSYTFAACQFPTPLRQDAPGCCDFGCRRWASPSRDDTPADMLQTDIPHTPFTQTSPDDAIPWFQRGPAAETARPLAYSATQHAPDVNKTSSAENSLYCFHTQANQVRNGQHRDDIDVGSRIRHGDHA